MDTLDTLADQFYRAFYRKEWVGESAAGLETLSMAEAYRVQDLVAERRVDSGERLAGYKVGCTSKAIRSQFGLTEPICARLFEPHIVEEGACLDRNAYANCAIEPELVLKICADLRGEDLSDDELIDCIEYVSPGIEIHDFTFWHREPSLQELICSGGIHAGLVVGSARVPPRDLQFRDELFSVYMDDTPVTSAAAIEIMGGPLHSLRWLVSYLTARGKCLEKNSLVIPGSPTELVEVDRDAEVKVVIEKLGEAVASFKSNE